MFEDDRLYYRVRSEQERRQAEATQDKAVKRIHLCIAAEYGRRAGAMEDSRPLIPA